MPSMGVDNDEEGPCRACTDFKTWAKTQQKSNIKSKVAIDSSESSDKNHRRECPLDKDELGRQTWGLLHTMAAYYPAKPSKAQKTSMVEFFNSFANFYPCKPCAEDFQKDIEVNPPQTQSKDSLAKWLCERHNVVNNKLGKPEFDCNKVNERWKDGWKDGSCDT